MVDTRGVVLAKRRVHAAAGALAVTVVLAVPALAGAAGMPAAPASAYTSTPDCPVSAADPVCSWNVPADSGNPFSAGDYGECPYWAAEKYPLLVADELLADPLGTDWNGSTWLEHAQLEGLTTSSTPAVGDLAVWNTDRPTRPATSPTSRRLPPARSSSLRWTGNPPHRFRRCRAAPSTSPRRISSTTPSPTTSPTS